MAWDGFRGAAKRLDDIDLPKVGALIGVGEDEIHAIMDVEAAGSGFDKTGRPRILFERHYFYKHLSGPKLDRAIREGLAVKKWSRATYGKDQYSLLAQAMKIDETAALKSASWGLGQIMGANHKMAGYATVQAMVRDFMEDEEHHLRAMIEFIKSAGLAEKVRRHDWAGFAKGYNGPGYKSNKYDTKLAAAYAKWKRIKDTPYNPAATVAVASPSKPAAIPPQEPQGARSSTLAGKGPALAATTLTGLVFLFWERVTETVCSIPFIGGICG